MNHRNSHCLYEDNHDLQIFHRNIFKETRCLHVSFIDYHDYIQIKLRDPSDFVFNYTTNVDIRQFELMKSEQYLDINFSEFRANLIDMLHQVQKHELFLKCEVDLNTAKLIFYGKTKIKSIVFLTVDLQMTNQKEIFDEMNESISELRSLNNNLTSQLQLSKSRLQEKDAQIEKNRSLNEKLERRFCNELDSLNSIFCKKIQDCSALLLQKVLVLTKRLLKLIQDVEIVKAESLLKSDSCARLVQSMENLRLESIETTRVIDDLKRENCHLKAVQLNNEKIIAELNNTIFRSEAEVNEIKTQRDEFERDAKQAALIIAQKATTNEELGRDVVKANQMLISFNHLLDTKNEEIEILKASSTEQLQAIQDYKHQLHDVCQEFNNYKNEFNQEGFNKILQDLSAANRRLEEVEKVNRETAKLNELLTRKLASGDFSRRNFH